MLLVDPALVLERATLSQRTAGVDTVARSVVEAAHSVVENILSTNLNARMVTDYFADPGRNASGVLHLSSMFVSTAPAPKVYWNSYEIFVPRTGDILEKDNIFFNEEDQSICLHPGIRRRLYYAVEYRSGFSVGGNNIAQDVPPWLQQAVITAALHVLQTQAITHQKSIEQRDYSQLLRVQLYNQISQKIPHYVGKNLPSRTSARLL